MHRALTLGTSGLCWRGVERGTVTDNGLWDVGPNRVLKKAEPWRI